MPSPFDVLRDLKASGQVDPLTGEVKSAAAALKLFRAELNDTTRTVSGSQSAGGAVRSGVAQVAAGGIRALGQPGAGGVDALAGAVKGLSDALPAIGAAVGFVAAGPLGAAVGGLVGTAGSAVIDRVAGPGMAARDAAISEVSGLTASRAASGMTAPPEAMAAMFEGAAIRAGRIKENEAAVRSSANSVMALQLMLGSGR
jgi:hypothetical protein